MSVADKTRFITEIRYALSSVITVADMQQIEDVLADRLTGYDIDWLGRDYTGQDDYVDAYLDALEISGRSTKTIDRYRYVIQKLLDSLKIPSKEVSVFDIRSFLRAEKSRGIADRTLEGYREIFHAYFGWLHREGLIRLNPADNVGPVKCMKTIKDIFTDVDIEKLKLACTNIRDKAIVTFLRSTGCRISEATQLNRSDVDLINKECKVLGKGGKERIVYLDEIAVMNLTSYFNARKDDSPALFHSLRGERIQPNGVRMMLKTLERKSGVANVHPHKFRRTLATSLIRRGMPIEEVAKILGHDKLDTTMGYIVLDQTDIKHAYIKFA